MQAAAATSRSLALIAALDEGGVIGRAGGLPWRLPEDLQHFKRLTLGKTVLMGRRTWDSLGRALPGRRNWVLTRDPAFRANGATVFSNIEQALAAHHEGELVVIGGADLYRQALPLADRMYLTLVHARVEGDTHFPPYDAAQFVVAARQEHPADDRHAHPFSFVDLHRR